MTRLFACKIFRASILNNAPSHLPSKPSVPFHGYPVFASLQNARNVDKSELGQLKDLEHWIDIKTVVTKSFKDSSPSLAKTEKVDSYDLQKFRSRTVDSDNATYLKGLEVSANIRKGLSGLQRDFIDGIKKGKTDSMKSSRSVTFMVSSHLSSYIHTLD